MNGIGTVRQAYSFAILEAGTRVDLQITETALLQNRSVHVARL